MRPICVGEAIRAVNRRPSDGVAELGARVLRGRRVEGVDTMEARVLLK